MTARLQSGVRKVVKEHEEFRLVEETDIIREILRGYNEYLENGIKLLEDNLLKVESVNTKINKKT